MNIFVYYDKLLYATELVFNRQVLIIRPTKTFLISLQQATLNGLSQLSLSIFDLHKSDLNSKFIWIYIRYGKSVRQAKFIGLYIILMSSILLTSISTIWSMTVFMQYALVNEIKKNTLFPTQLPSKWTNIYLHL